MSTILADLGRQRCLSAAAAAGSTCRQRCDGFASHGSDFSWSFSVVAYERLLATIAVIQSKQQTGTK